MVLSEFDVHFGLKLGQFSVNAEFIFRHGCLDLVGFSIGRDGKRTRRVGDDSVRHIHVIANEKQLVTDSEFDGVHLSVAKFNVASPLVPIKSKITHALGQFGILKGMEGIVQVQRIS